MIRSFISVTKILSNYGISKLPLLSTATQKTLVASSAQRYFSLFQPKVPTTLFAKTLSLSTPHNVSSRTVTKYSMRKGKRKSVKAVVKRFYRLNWGIWIRRIAGCHKKLWKKSPPRKRRLRQHVFCNSTQSYMLDKMVGSYWRRPRYVVDDPYEPYHVREEFQFTYRKPRPYFPPEQSSS